MIFINYKIDDLMLEEYNEVFYEKKTFDEIYENNIVELVEFLDSDLDSNLDEN